MKKIILPLITLVLLGAGCPLLYRDTPANIEPPSMPDVFDFFSDDGQELVNDVLRHEHSIGQSHCPDPLPPMTVTAPPELAGAEIPVTTDATWLDLPDFVTPGVPFEMLFNCNIADFTNHSEVGQVNLQLDRFIELNPGLEHLAGTESGGTFFVIVDACNGPCPADFALPYICCSDCPPIQVISGGKPPVAEPPQE